jgi:hypothetical protein
MESGKVVEFGLHSSSVGADAQNVFGDLVVGGLESEAEHQLTVDLDTPLVQGVFFALVPEWIGTRGGAPLRRG